MKVITWTDECGYCHRSLIRDDDPDDKAAEIGVPADPPDLDRLNWDELYLMGIDVAEFKRKLHNRLVRSGLITWADVQYSQNGLTTAIMAVGRDRKILAALKRQLVTLYRQ
jgi:hypothetical protein